MRVVTGFLGEQEFARESGARFQLESVATCGAVERCLQVAAGRHRENFAGSGSIGERAFHGHAWQFGGTVKLGWVRLGLLRLGLVSIGWRRHRLAESRLTGSQGDEHIEQQPDLE